MAEPEQNNTLFPGWPDDWILLAEVFQALSDFLGAPQLACDDLWRALVGGRIRCLRRRGSELVELRRTYWRNIKFFVQNDRLFVKALDQSDITGCFFYLVRPDLPKVSSEIWPSAAPDETRSEPLISANPDDSVRFDSSTTTAVAGPIGADREQGPNPVNTPASAAHPGDSPAEASTRAFLANLMREDPENKERRNKDAVKKECQKRWDVPTRAFDIIWTTCIQETGAVAYKKRGPRGEHKAQRPSK